MSKFREIRLKNNVYIDTKNGGLTLVAGSVLVHSAGEEVYVNDQKLEMLKTAGGFLRCDL